ADTPPLSEQLVGLGKQALAQGRATEAQDFFRQALKLDPKNSDARQALASEPLIRRVAYQDPGQDAPKPAPDAPPAPATPAPLPEPPQAGDQPPPPPVPAGDQPKQATIEHAQEMEKILAQHLTADVNERLKKAQDLLNAGNPESALESLRLALSAIQT